MKRLLTIALTGMLTMAMLVPAWADEVSANAVEEEAIVEALADEEVAEDADSDIEAAEAEDDEDVIVIDVDDLEEVTDEDAVDADEADSEDIEISLDEEEALNDVVLDSSEDAVESLGSCDYEEPFAYASNTRNYVKGMKIQLAYPADSYATSLLGCTSSNPALVSVTDSGFVTVLGKSGSATISGMLDGYTPVTYTINVGKQWKPNIKLPAWGTTFNSYTGDSKQYEKKGMEYTLKSVDAKTVKMTVKNCNSCKADITISKIILGNKTFKVKKTTFTLNKNKKKNIKLSGSFKLNQIAKEDYFNVKVNVKFVAGKCK